MDPIGGKQPVALPVLVVKRVVVTCGWKNLAPGYGQWWTTLQISTQANDWDYLWGSKLKQKSVFPLNSPLPIPTPQISCFWDEGSSDAENEILSAGISCVQFDDTRIASGSYDKTIRVWDIKSGDCNAVLTLAGHSGTVRCLNLNGNQLVSGSVDRSIKVM